MPRRRLDRRPVPLLDPETVTTYLVTCTGYDLYRHPDRLPPVTSCSLFGNDQPLELEVGCGSGEFLCALANEHPERNFVGIEINRKSLHRAMWQASNARLDNVVFLKANVRPLAPLLLPDSLDTVYLHFPDPAMRTKYRKRRVFDAAFLDAMHRAVRAGGLLSVMTDHRILFMEMLEIAERDDRWQKTHNERFLIGFNGAAASRYQRLWEGIGLETLRFELRKTDGLRRSG